MHTVDCHIDIYLEVLLLSAYNVQHRKGHLDQEIPILAYLNPHNHSSIVCDYTLPNINDKRFPNHNRKDLKGDKIGGHSSESTEGTQ